MNNGNMEVVQKELSAALKSAFGPLAERIRKADCAKRVEKQRQLLKFSKRFQNMVHAAKRGQKEAATARQDADFAKDRLAHLEGMLKERTQELTLSEMKNDALEKQCQEIYIDNKQLTTSLASMKKKYESGDSREKKEAEDDAESTLGDLPLKKDGAGPLVIPNPFNIQLGSSLTRDLSQKSQRARSCSPKNHAKDNNNDSSLNSIENANQLLERNHKLSRQLTALVTSLRLITRRRVWAEARADTLKDELEYLYAHFGMQDTSKKSEVSPENGHQQASSRPVFQTAESMEAKVKKKYEEIAARVSAVGCEAEDRAYEFLTYFEHPSHSSGGGIIGGGKHRRLTLPAFNVTSSLSTNNDSVNNDSSTKKDDDNKATPESSLSLAKSMPPETTIGVFAEAPESYDDRHVEVSRDFLTHLVQTRGKNFGRFFSRTRAVGATDMAKFACLDVLSREFFAQHQRSAHLERIVLAMDNLAHAFQASFMNMTRCRLFSAEAARRRTLASLSHTLQELLRAEDCKIWVLNEAEQCLWTGTAVIKTKKSHHFENEENDEDDDDFEKDEFAVTGRTSEFTIPLQKGPRSLVAHAHCGDCIINVDVADEDARYNASAEGPRFSFTCNNMHEFVQQFPTIVYYMKFSIRLHSRPE